MSEDRPALRVVRGTPTPEELAALTAIVAAAGAGSDAPAPGIRRGGWSDPSVRHRHELIPGPNAWRSSSW
jgi:Acyl-CoA carboxylase epsilon subunit